MTKVFYTSDTSKVLLKCDHCGRHEVAPADQKHPQSCGAVVDGNLCYGVIQLEGIPVIRSSLVPPGKAYVIDLDAIKMPPLTIDQVLPGVLARSTEAISRLVQELTTSFLYPRILYTHYQPMDKSFWVRLKFFGRSYVKSCRLDDWRWFALGWCVLRRHHDIDHEFGFCTLCEWTCEQLYGRPVDPKSMAIISGIV